MVKTSELEKDGTEAGDEGTASTLAKLIAEAPVGVLPMTSGARMKIWKQDPTVGELGIRKVYIHTKVNPGPRDSQIKIEGVPVLYPDVNGDFLFESNNNEAIDAAHTYAVVRQVLTMYQRVLGEKMKWQWNTGENTDPISVFPHAGEAWNAYYSRSERALRFFYFTPTRSRPSSQKVFTCRSLDIVAHEVGHAILDALKPAWLSWLSPPQTGGLHESFADCTAIFLALSQLDQVEYVIAQTKADLHQKNVLAELAEQFGYELGRPSGLRNADNNLKLSEVTSQVHDISKVFTGGIYDTLADAFLAGRDPRKKNDAVVLYEVGQKMATLMVSAFKAAPARNATFADVVDKMITIANDNPSEYPQYATFVQKHFEFREVLGNSAVAGPQSVAGFPLNTAGCCGTMQNLEYAGE